MATGKELASVLAFITADSKSQIAEIAAKQPFIRDKNNVETEKRRAVHDDQKSKVVASAIRARLTELQNAVADDVLGSL